MFVSNGLSQPGVARETATAGTAPPDLPKIGITNGRIGELPRGDRVGGPTKESFCAAERMRLANHRFRGALPRSADATRGRPTSRSTRSRRPGSRAFPSRAAAASTWTRITPRPAPHRLAAHAWRAKPTGSRSSTPTICAGGMRRIANDLQSYYVLGYYTTNTKWDGRAAIDQGPAEVEAPRPGRGRDTIRARRQYRAPTLEEIAAFSTPAAARAPSPPSAEETALAALARARPDGSILPPTATSGDRTCHVARRGSGRVSQRRAGGGPQLRADRQDPRRMDGVWRISKPGR